MIVIAASSDSFEESATGWSTALAPPILSRDRKTYDGTTPPGSYRATAPTTSALNFDTPPVSQDKLRVLEQFRGGPGSGARVYKIDPALQKQYAEVVANTVFRNQNPFGRSNFGR